MLTDKQIRGLKPREKEYIVSDDDRSRGTGRLVLRVRPSGSKTWQYHFHVAGKKRKKALGSYPEVSLVRARAEVARLAEVRSSGRVGTEAMAEETLDTGGTLGELLGAYVAHLREKGKRSADEVEAGFKRWIERPKPLLWEKRADLVTPADIRDLLAYHIRRGLTTGANRMRSYLHAAYNYGLSAEYNPRVAATRVWGLTVNPVGAVPSQADYERPGKRVLTPEELAHAWHHLPATPTLGWRMPRIIQLAIATGGQRPTMLLRLRRADVDLEQKVLDIPGDATKNEKPHVVPLEPLALAIVEELVAQAVEEGHELLFPAGHGKEGSIRTNSVTKSLAAYREHYGTALWTLRDVRRTVKTMLGQKKVSKDLRDRLQGHALSDVSSKHYDRYDYLDEKREALRVWDRHLAAILDSHKPK